MSELKNVGYIGLGNIGKPCARRLIGDRYRAHVYDIEAEAVQELTAAGAVGCASAAEVAQNCTQIGICVRDEAQVENLLYGGEGIFAQAAAGTLVAIHSTVTRAAILKWAAEAEDQDVRLIDAGISGGAQGAEAGTLVYMVGGDEKTLAEARPVFKTSGEQVIHAGPIGSGMVLKLCNNLIQYMGFMAMSEATRLANACGLSADLLHAAGQPNGVVNDNMLKFVSGRNALAANCTAEQLEGVFGPFGKLGEKDLDCALDCAEQLGVELPAAAGLRRSIYDLFVNRA